MSRAVIAAVAAAGRKSARLASSPQETSTRTFSCAAASASRGVRVCQASAAERAAVRPFAKHRTPRCRWQSGAVSSDSPVVQRLAGSVKEYDRHAVVVSGAWYETWEPRLENAFDHEVASYVESVVGGSRDVKVTAAYDEDLDEDSGTHDLMVWPDAVRLRELDEDDIDAVGSILSGDGDVGEAAEQLGLDATPVTGTTVLICCHAQRNFKCSCGPGLVATVEELKNERGLDDLQVYPSSHVGGHRFAGCVITYPSGDWFGCVSNKEHLSAIVDHVHASRGEEVAPVEETASVLSAHWRGRMGMTKVEAAELAIEVAE